VRLSALVGGVGYGAEIADVLSHDAEALVLRCGEELHV
jgi:hypothetical protein